MRVTPGRDACGSRRRGQRYWLPRLAAMLLVGTAGAASAADNAWLDLESRIQYAYFTEDARTLRGLADSASSDTQDRLKSYYAALLAYRLGLLAQDAQAPTEQGRREAREMLGRCVSTLDKALETQSDFAEALALQSACLGLLAEHNAWRTPFAGSRSTTQIHKALRLAPRNPRVLLLDAIGAYERARAGGEGIDPAVGKFRKAVAAFEEERASFDRVPGWGAAEAYTWLARSYLDRGDAVAARDALERALLIAPEFVQARRLIAHITSG